jgi:hypothetical protein
MFTQYQQLIGNQSQLNSQKIDLDASMKQLKSEMVAVKDNAERYDREFLDRKNAGEGTYTTAQRLGLVTVQDWVLLFFFGSYALAILVLALNAYKFAPKAGLGIGIILVLGLVFGLMTAVVLIKLG